MTDNLPILPRHIYGVLGMPLGHSLSPALHSWSFAQTGHPGAYFAFEKTAEELPDFFRTMRSLPIAGLSVTLPHKQAVGAYLDEITPTAQAAGAVNTVHWRNGKLVGHNTDVEGFLAPLTALAHMSGKPLPELLPAALLLGAGGVCRAALVGLRQSGIRNVTVAARDTGKAAPLQQDFGCRVIDWENRANALRDMGPGLIINTTPLGMHGERKGQSPLTDDMWAALPKVILPALEQGARPLPEDAASTSTEPLYMAYDLVYNPLETRFLAQARAQGLRTQDGLTLFVEQGLAQFRLWTGLCPSEQDARHPRQDALRALLLHALDRQRAENNSPS